MYFQSNIIPTLESDTNKIMVFVISITSFHLAISKHLQAFINSQYPGQIYYRSKLGHKEGEQVKGNQKNQ